MSSIYAGAVTCGACNAFNDENFSNKLKKGANCLYLTASAYFVDVIAHALVKAKVFSALLSLKKTTASVADFIALATDI